MNQVKVDLDSPDWGEEQETALLSFLQAQAQQAAKLAELRQRRRPDALRNHPGTPERTLRGNL